MVQSFAQGHTAEAELGSKPTLLSDLPGSSTRQRLPNLQCSQRETGNSPMVELEGALGGPGAQ
jgi:hypothetical protein